MAERGGRLFTGAVPPLRVQSSQLLRRRFHQLGVFIPLETDHFQVPRH